MVLCIRMSVKVTKRKKAHCISEPLYKYIVQANDYRENEGFDCQDCQIMFEYVIALFCMSQI